MENTSDSFMPRPLLFCLKSGRSVCYSVPDNTSVHFEAKNVTEEDKEFLEKAFAFVERMYKIPDKNLRNKLMENAEKNFEGSMELIELMNGKVS